MRLHAKLPTLLIFFTFDSIFSFGFLKSPKPAQARRIGGRPAARLVAPARRGGSELLATPTRQAHNLKGKSAWRRPIRVRRT